MGRGTVRLVEFVLVTFVGQKRSKVSGAYCQPIELMERRSQQIESIRPLPAAGFNI